MSCSLMPMLGLLMVGLTSNMGTIRQTTAANLAADLSNDLRAATASSSPCYGLQVPSTGNAVINTVMLTADGAETSTPSTTQPTYLATVVVTPSPASSSLSAGTARILITWPVPPNQAKGTIPTRYLHSFQTVIGLSRND